MQLNLGLKVRITGEDGLTISERRQISKLLQKLGYNNPNEFARKKGFNSAREMAFNYNFKNVRDFFLDENVPLSELIDLARDEDLVDDKIVKFEELVEKYASKPRSGCNYATELFGNNLEDIIKNTLEFYQHYQPTRQLFSQTGPPDFLEKCIEKYRNDKYIITNITPEIEKSPVFARGVKGYKVEEKIKYTPEKMLLDVEYNAKIAHILANIVDSRIIYEVGPGHGTLALGLSILTHNNIITIESDPYCVELQKQMHSNLSKKINGKLIIEEAMPFSKYIEKHEIIPDSFIVCSKGDWKIFDEIVYFGAKRGTDMFVSRDFYEQKHIFAPVDTAPEEAYRYVRNLLKKTEKNGNKYKIMMTRKDLDNEDDPYVFFNEFLIQKKKN